MTTNDPVTQIKKAELTSKENLDAATREFEEDLKKYKEQLMKKRGEFEQNLKDSGNEKLNNVKKEAGAILKAKMESAESEKATLMKNAESKLKNSIGEIVTTFLTYIKG